MTKLAVLFATAVALASPDIAQAASPDGDHVFTGTVEIRKNLPVWVTCSMTAVINVTAAVPTLKSVAVTGAGPCTAISFFSLPSAPLVPGVPPLVSVPSIGMSFGSSCFGDLKFIWGGNMADPRTITFQNSLSDLPGTPPCKIQGTIAQSPGVLNLP